MINYSDYAIVLNWEIINDEPDIGNWKMLFEEDNSEIIGKGMSELLEALLQLKTTQVNVIYVKNLNLFEVIGENYFSYLPDFNAGIKEGQINFFVLKITETIELRNWDNFFSDTDDETTVIERLNIVRNNFKGLNKNKLSLQSHLKFTMANDQWSDIVDKYYLKGPWSDNFRNSLLPKDEDELDLYLKINKASYFFINRNYIGKVVKNVYGSDISTSHGGFILRKKYPTGNREKLEDKREIIKTMEKDWYAWIGRFEFEGLYEKENLPIDLRNFGEINENDNWELILTNAHWKTFKRLFGADNIIPLDFYRFENKELPKNYALMINTLFEEKEWYKKYLDMFIKHIFKFRTELSFGQSIKAPTYYQAIIYNEEENKFEKLKLNREPFENIIKRIKRYAIPFQIGIWTAAYSWAEEVNMILDIGIDNVIYGDTDCVKFIGEEGFKIIKAHNEEIDKETEIISKKRNMLETSKKIGRWQDEGTFTRFKAIGVKWYLFESDKGLEVKAAGANVEKLQEWIEQQNNPFEAFDKEMYVPELFKNININRDNGTVHVSFNNYMGDQKKREMIRATNGFII